MHALIRSLQTWRCALAGVVVGGLAAVVLLMPLGAASGGSSSVAANASPGRELPERRTQSSRTYLRDDGGMVTRFFTHAVNFRDGSGAWRPVDNALARTADGYANKANRYRVELPESLSRPVRVSEGGAWVEYGLAGGTASASVDGNRARYVGAARGVDLAYDAESDSVKETLTLAGPESARSFRFTLKASPGLVAKERSNGAVEVVERDGDVAFSFAAPLMWDSSNRPSGVSRAIAVELAAANDGYTIEVTPDRRWLDAKQRRWPVVIDPTVGFSGSERDCYIVGQAQDDPDSLFYNQAYCATGLLAVGMNQNYVCLEVQPECFTAHPPHRTLLKFNLGSAIPNDAVVKMAGLWLYSNGGGPITVDAHGMTRPWTSSLSWARADTNVPWWSSGGDFESNRAARNATAGGTFGWATWYPTGLVSRWISGETPNDGLLLKQSTESGTAGAIFDSTEAGNASRKPYLEVQWEVPTGERSFNTFVDQQLTDRSDLGVNVASGNLLVRNEDLEISGTGVDLLVPRFYNSRSTTSGSLGQGWNMGTGEDVRLFDRVDGSVLFYGPSGELLRFAPNEDGGYESPPGMRATLRRLTGVTHALTYHDGGERLTFTSSGSWSAYRLAAQADRYGNAIRFAYDQDRLTSITDTQGRVVTVARNAWGRIERLTDWTGRSVRYGYDGQGRLQSFTDAAARATTYGYDPSGRLSSITSPAGRVAKVAYHPDGRVSQVVRTTDANRTTGPTTKYSYSAGAPCASGETKAVVLDPLATGANGHTTTYCSDAAGAVRSRVDAHGSVTSYSYDPRGNLDLVTHPTGRYSHYVYDERERLLCAYRGRERRANCFAYDGILTRFEYANTDALTRHFPTRVTSPRGSSLVLCYNGSTPACGMQSGPAGSLQSITSQLGSRRFEYNGKGHLTAATDALGSKTAYGYDAGGDHLTSVTPPSGAGLGAWRIEPDALSRTRAVTDGRGNVATYGYDPLDRTVGTTHLPGGPDFQYAYDPDGPLRTLTDPGGPTTYTVDDLLRLTREDFPGGGFNSYAYDDAGNLTALTDPGGTTAYAYDEVNRLAYATGAGGAGFSYDRDGARTQIRYPSGVTVDTAYDESGRVKSVTNRGRFYLGPSFAYNYEGSHLPHTVTDAAGRVTRYAYDALDRLTGAVTGSSSVTYTLDGNGNRLSQTVDRGDGSGLRTESIAYDPAGLPCWRAAGRPNNPCGAPPAGAEPYSHDANGSDLDNTRQRFAYNPARQATSVLVGEVGAAASLGYRGEGQSQPARDGSYALQGNVLGIGVRAYGPQPGAPAPSFHEEEGTCGGTFPRPGATSYYARAADDGTLLSQRTPATGELRNYLYDGRGSVVGLTGPDGFPETYYAYDPHGRAQRSKNPDHNPFGYLGAYTAGVEDRGAACGGPSLLGGLAYDPADGRLTQSSILNAQAAKGADDGLSAPRRARDQAGRHPDGRPNRDSPVYVGGQASDGRVMGTGNGPRGSGVHAEDIIQGAMPGARMTEPYAWRRNLDTGELEWRPFTVCPRCQGNYPRGLFEPGTRGERGGPWGD